MIEKSIDTMLSQFEQLHKTQHILEHLLTCPRDNPIHVCPVLRNQLEDALSS